MEFAEKTKKEEVMDKATIAEWFQAEDVELDDEYLDLINDTMEKNGWSRECVLKEKVKWPKRRLWRIISCDCDLQNKKKK